jgi:Immunity protein 10
MLVIQADTVSVDESNPATIAVAFAENEPTTGVVRHYLLLERTHEFDDDVVKVGEADVYVELDSQARACYGGVTRFRLLRDRAHVVFDETAARHLGDVEAVEVRLDAGVAEFDRLRAGLQQVFNGFACFEDAGGGLGRS